MNEYCFDIHDVEEVSECPQNEEDAYSAALNKRCTLNKPICCKPEVYDYHCLLSGDGTRFYEFCACKIEISYCAELNLFGQRIQANFHAQCRPGIIECGRFYNSSRAFEVPLCFKQTSSVTEPSPRSDIEIYLTRNESLRFKFPDKTPQQSMKPDMQTVSEYTSVLKVVEKAMVTSNENSLSQQNTSRPEEESFNTTLGGTLTDSLNTTGTYLYENSTSSDDDSLLGYIDRFKFFLVPFYVMIAGFFLVLFLKIKQYRYHRNNRRNRSLTIDGNQGYEYLEMTEHLRENMCSIQNRTYCINEELMIPHIINEELMIPHIINEELLIPHINKENSSLN